MPKAGRMIWVVLLLFSAACTSSVSGSRAELLQKLSDLVEKDQVTKTSITEDYSKPTELEGMYQNYFRLNTHGKCEQSAFRRNFKLPSVSPFVAGIVGSIIMDAYRLGKAPKPSPISIERIVKMYEGFHYRNVDYNTSLINYLPQKYNEEQDYWYLTPVSEMFAYKMAESLNIDGGLFVKTLLGDNVPPHFGALFNPTHFIEHEFLPPDFDSSGIHLGFGSTLYTLREEFPKAWDRWAQDNTNLTSVYDQAKKYAYRPFSGDPDSSFIDPKTYYGIRDFLDQAKAEGRDLALLNTWAQNMKELWRDYDKGTFMPYCVNNVDVSIAANFLSGLILSVSSGLLEPDYFSQDEDFQLLFKSVGDMMVHLVKNDFADRPDIVLVYYPSEIQVYWFIARCLLYLENSKVDGRFPNQMFEDFHVQLSDAMRNEATTRLLTMGVTEANGDVHYDDFLGNADISYYGKPIKRYEDRVFTTAMAANALLYIWTVNDKENGTRWIESTPDIVKETVRGSAKWLEANTLTGEYSLSSIFYCRLVHSFETIGYWYPANRFEYRNGTTITDYSVIPAEWTAYGVEGYIEPDEYEKMLNELHFGVPTPRTFEGVNNSNGTLSFWGSESHTMASVLLALSLEEQVNS